MKGRSYRGKRAKAQDSESVPFESVSYNVATKKGFLGEGED